MKGRRLSFAIYSLILVVVLVVSAIYRVGFYKSYANEKESLPLELRDKTIVRLWMKKNIISPTRSYQIEKFNKENKDNIHIIFTEYKEDYYNAIRTTLASGHGPDIFEYGFTTLMKNNQIASLDEIGFDKSKVNESNIVTYKHMPIGVKLMETNVKFVWNKEMFKKAGLDPEKPPRTWNDVIQYSLQIKKKFPNSIPFAFPIKEYEDLKVAIGEPSANEGNIYTTFWDYKSGKYDFNYAKNILNTYSQMYKLNLIDKNFDKKSRNQLRSEFYRQDIAMMLSTYEDKGYFSNIVPLSFDMGVKDVIQTNNKKDNVYYYVQDMNFLVVNKDSIQDKKKVDAINKVYEYLLSEGINKEVLQTRNALPVNLKETKCKNDIYTEYNNVSKFRNESYDPTIFLSRNSSYEIGAVIDSIKGKITVNSSIDKLNKQYDKYYNFAKTKENFDFSYYKQ